MAITSPDNLRTPDPSDSYNLVADLATLAADVQSALTLRGNSYVGTSTQRQAFKPTAPEGSQWQDTDGDKRQWVKKGANWEAEVTVSGVTSFASTAAGSAATNTVNYGVTFSSPPALGGLRVTTALNNLVLYYGSTHTTTQCSITMRNNHSGNQSPSVAWSARGIITA